ncbi:unnamed protein product [Callosobruchus maculatus]|uniref:MADF domain-containing protein n=1 Tax=Callosobruchus maculatus TaxID=64391 RepID=A0A653D9Z8_CALMS|nr:unnamed protein product [Callosobruchus chinensis]VEN56853.1 unnamed protein product [Callosobruchus maculatus]
MDYDMRLIGEVRRYPELYDGRHKDFKNKEVKHAVWCNIAYKLRKEYDEAAVKVVRSRWKSLRDSYVKETKHRMALSAGQNVKPRKNWRYSSAMSFLAPHLAIGFPLPSKSGVDKQEEKEDEMDTLLEEQQQQQQQHQETSAAVASVAAASMPVMPNQNGNVHFLGAFLQEYPPRNPPGMPPTVETENYDIDSFFRGVADTVKRLSPVNQVKIQRDIVNLVLDIKLKEYMSRAGQPNQMPQ